jgi:SAM-dependent methyltransferase
VTLLRDGATALTHEFAHRVGGRLLELGAGLNPYAGLWPSARVVTLDHDPARGPAVVGDAHALPFADGCFDSVVASQVLEHLHSPWVAARELGRVLRPGGALVVSVPFMFMVHAAPHDFFRFTEFGLRRLFEEEFEIDVLRAYGGRLGVVYDAALAPSPSSTLPRRALARAVRGLRRPDKGRRYPVRSRVALAGRSAEHPLGYFMVATRRGGAG